MSPRLSIPFTFRSPAFQDTCNVPPTPTVVVHRLAEGIFKAIGREIYQSDPELAARFEPDVKRIYSRHDYHEHGGAPLLGVNGVCLISHGSSVARTISNAVLRCKQFVESKVNQEITRRLGAMQEAVA